MESSSAHVAKRLSLPAASALVKGMEDAEVVLVHGNRPQVGLLARESADGPMTPGVITDVSTPEAAVLPELAPASLAALALPSGSMRPKAEAAAEFATATGRSAVIGPLDHAEAVVAGILGTRVGIRA